MRGGAGRFVVLVTGKAGGVIEFTFAGGAGFMGSVRCQPLCGVKFVTRVKSQARMKKAMSGMMNLREPSMRPSGARDMPVMRDQSEMRKKAAVAMASAAPKGWV